MLIMLKKGCFKKHLFIVWGDFHNLKDNYDVAVDSCVSDCLMRLMEGEHQAIDLRQWRLLLSLRCFASLCACAEWPCDQISCFLSFSFFTFNRSAGHSPSFQPADIVIAYRPLGTGSRTLKGVIGIFLTFNAALTRPTNNMATIKSYFIIKKMYQRGHDVIFIPTFSVFVDTILMILFLPLDS